MAYIGISMTDQLIYRIQSRLIGDLPGKAAQKVMAPNVRFTGRKYPDPSDSRDSGVLILLFPDIAGWSTVFIERTIFGPHGGQISLPGGKKEPHDQNIIATALRETMEEIGVEKNDIQVIGELTSLYVPNSNFCINPVVGFMQEKPEMVKEDKEVKSIIRITIDKLFDSDNKGVRSFKRSGYDISAPYYNANGHVIWGATAMIMSEFEAVVKNNP